eukprot:331821-Pyramimonas_sp.AAC.1
MWRSPPSPRPAPRGWSPAWRHSWRVTVLLIAFTRSCAPSSSLPRRRHSEPSSSIQASGARGIQPMSRRAR